MEKKNKMKKIFFFFFFFFKLKNKFFSDTGYRSLPDKYKEEEIDNYPYCPVFKQIGNIHGPFDIASIPVGPVLPPHMMSPIHATARVRIISFIIYLKYFIKIILN